MKKAESESENTVAPETAAPSETVASEQPDMLSPEQVNELKANAAKAAEHWDRLVRTMADFDNYKKRAVREKQEAIRFANEGLMEKLVPVLDNFEIALAAAQTAGTEASQSMATGVNMILQQLKNVLVETGLEEINATGQPFDPNIHEAVSQQESSEAAEGTVLQQLRTGYRLRERLIRPATVIVAKAPTAP
ncbi:MAG TPA: nucleotide exchange factor GrpE [Verrucomicrobiae bacterium]|nr:nucleotide exchange factor GrpE [Verrucomicrobiae bacterium]